MSQFSISKVAGALFKADFNDGKSPPAELKAFDPKELAEKAEAYFYGIQTNKKCDKARAVFTTYITGKSLAQSAEAAEASKATGSAYLNEIEKETGIAFIRGKQRENSAGQC